MTKAPWSMIELFSKRWSTFNSEFPYVRDDMTRWSFEASPLAGEVREPRQLRERVSTPTRCNVWNEATRRRSRRDGTRIKIEARWKVNFWRIDLTLFITVFLYRTLTFRAREPTTATSMKVKLKSHLLFITTCVTVVLVGMKTYFSAQSSCDAMCYIYY